MSRGWLLPLAPLFGAAVAAKDLAYTRGWLRPQTVRWPVLSVGNLSVGGAGKTPLVLRLAELLAAQNLAVDILSRGYGRHSHAVELVDPTGDARRYGDEPLLLARRTQLPVALGASRYAAGLLAEQRLASSSRGVHLLDDGFQHRRLARDADIVLVHRSDFAERLLPAGRLREPLSALGRAQFLVLRESDADLESRIRALNPTGAIWWMQRTLDIPTAAPRPLAFCAIARPAEFFSSLAAAGLSLAATRAFSDHHQYTANDIRTLTAVARQSGAQSFLTTEKDAVKLEPRLREQLEQAAPLQVVRLSVTLRDEAALVRDLLARIRYGTPHP